MSEMPTYRPKTAEQHIDAVIEGLGDRLPTRSLLVQYAPHDEWFLRGPGGIHGVTHETRVLLWQEILTLLQPEDYQKQVNRDALRWSATTHDLRRQDDGFDRDHGIRSADWTKEHLSHVIPSDAMESVIYVNTWHVPPDHKAPKMTQELTLFKDADALDRWRLEDDFPGVLTFIDTRKLRHEETKSTLLLPAKVLYEKTKNMKSQDFIMILDTAEELGLLRK